MRFPEAIIEDVEARVGCCGGLPPSSPTENLVEGPVIRRAVSPSPKNRHYGPFHRLSDGMVSGDRVSRAEKRSSEDRDEKSKSKPRDREHQKRAGSIYTLGGRSPERSNLRHDLEMSDPARSPHLHPSASATHTRSSSVVATSTTSPILFSPSSLHPRTRDVSGHSRSPSAAVYLTPDETSPPTSRTLHRHRRISAPGSPLREKSMSIESSRAESTIASPSAVKSPLAFGSSKSPKSLHLHPHRNNESLVLTRNSSPSFVSGESLGGPEKKMSPDEEKRPAPPPRLQTRRSTQSSLIPLGEFMPVSRPVLTRGLIVGATGRRSVPVVPIVPVDETQTFPLAKLTIPVKTASVYEQNAPRPSSQDSETVIAPVSLTGPTFIELQAPVLEETLQAQPMETRGSNEGPRKRRISDSSSSSGSVEGACLTQLGIAENQPRESVRRNLESVRKSDMHTYRDEVVTMLWDQLKDLAMQKVPAIQYCADAAHVMHSIMSELSQPMKDAKYGMNNAPSALALTIRKCQGFCSPPPTDLQSLVICTLTKLALRATDIDSGQALDDTYEKEGFYGFLADTLSWVTFDTAKPDFLSAGFELLTNGVLQHPDVAEFCRKHPVMKLATEVVLKASHDSPMSEAAHSLMAALKYDPPVPDAPNAVLRMSKARNLETTLKVAKKKARLVTPVDTSTTAKFVPADETITNMYFADFSEITSQVAQSDNPAHAVGYAQLVCTYATRRRVREVQEAGGHTILLEKLQTHADQPEVTAACLEAFSKMLYGSSPELREFIAREVPAAVKMRGSLISRDTTCCSEYINLLEDMMLMDEQVALQSMPVAKCIDDLEAIRLGPHSEDIQLAALTCCSRLKKDPENDEDLTLKKVYSILMTRQYNNESLNLTQDRKVRQMLYFIYRKLREYGCGEPVGDGILSFEGSEIMYGCLSLQLLGEVWDNRAVFCDTELPSLLIEVMRAQLDEQVAQHAVLTAVELAPLSELTAAFVDTQEKRETIVSMLPRGMEATRTGEYIAVEDLMIPRMQLVIKTAQTKSTFLNTTVIEELVNIWDDYDCAFYDKIRVQNFDDLKSVFRHDRRRRIITKVRRRRSSDAIDTRSPLDRRKQMTSSTGGNFLVRASQLWRRDKDDGGSLRHGPSLSRRRSSMASTRRSSAVSRASGSEGWLIRKRGSAAEDATRRSSAATQRGSAVSRRTSAEGDLPSWDENMFNSDYGDNDECRFVPLTLENLMAALRATAHESLYGNLNDRCVPMRLVGIISDPESPPACFADALYLIAGLSAYKDLKDKFGDWETIDRIKRLIKLPYKHEAQYVSETVTNGCFALATLVVLHLPNTRRFQKNGGVELVVDVLRVRGKMNDSKSVNAASALMCNLCFKNEDMKTALGEKDACPALVEAMAAYHAVSSEREGRVVNQTRNMASMFRAVGNLALHEKNMQILLDANIEKSFASFLGEADHELDNITIEACLRTLSNLAIEIDNMKTFQIVIIPFLSLLRKERHTSAEVHRWAFLTLASLCRWPENAMIFCKNAGVETVLMLLPFLEESPLLLASVILVLGIQTTHPPNVEVLLDADIFSTLADITRGFTELVKDNPDALDTLNAQLHVPIVASRGRASPVALKRSNTLRFGIQSSDLRRRRSVVLQTKKSVLEDGEDAPKIVTHSQLPITALRCAHRILRTPETAHECIKRDVFNLAQQCLLVSTFQPMITYESLRVIFATMALYEEDRMVKLEDLPILQSPVLKGRRERMKENLQIGRDNLLMSKAQTRTQSRKKSETQSSPKLGEYIEIADLNTWGGAELTLLKDGESPYDDYVVYEDPTDPEWQAVYPLQVRRPDEPRAWAQIGMHKNMNSLVETLRTILSLDRSLQNVRLQRLGLGFLTLCATDRVCLPTLLRRLNVAIDPVTRYPVVPDESEESEEDDDGESGVSGRTKKREKVKRVIKRRRSIWNAIKTRGKSSPKESKEEQFGYRRKPDPTSVVDILIRTGKNLWFDLDCVLLACILLNCLIFNSYGNEDFCELLGDVELLEELKKYVEVHEDDLAHPYVQLTIRNYTRFLQTEGRFVPLGESSPTEINAADDDDELSEDESPQKTGFRVSVWKVEKDDPVAKNANRRRKILRPQDLALAKALAIDTLPMELTQWNIDPYPDGVMSLPNEHRAKLRKGGRAEMFIDTGDKLTFVWKSSHDLIAFEWKTYAIDVKEKDMSDPTFPNSLATARFASMYAGCAHPNFQEAENKGNGNASPNRSCVLTGPCTPNYPDGVVLCLKFKDTSTRDLFLQLLSAWREACAFGFL